MAIFDEANIGRYGDRGYCWTVIYHPDFGDDDDVVMTYRTNEAGRGLWACGSYTGNDAHNYEDKQIEGTCQFDLIDHESDLRLPLNAVLVRIRHYFEAEELE